MSFFDRARLVAISASTVLIVSGCNSLAGAVLKPSTSTETAALEAGDFELDPRHAALLFRIDHLGFADYVGRFERFDASLSGDASNPEAAKVEAIIDMTSLDIADDAFAAELMGPDWFDAARYPQAVFRSVTIRRTGEATADVVGELTLHGVTQPLTLAVTFNGAAFDRLRGRDVAGFSASATIDRSAFGVDRFSGLITNEVRIEIEAEFVRASGG
jgi:polyisoprenoid-binding protein YceI